MALTHAAAGTVVYAGPLGERVTQAKTETLVNEPALQIFRLVLREAGNLADHRVPQALVFLCLEGELVFRTMDRELAMSAGDLCHVLPNELHGVTAKSAASALVLLYGPRTATAANDKQESQS